MLVNLHPSLRGSNLLLPEAEHPGIDSSDSRTTVAIPFTPNRPLLLGNKLVCYLDLELCTKEDARNPIVHHLQGDFVPANAAEFVRATRKAIGCDYTRRTWEYPARSIRSLVVVDPHVHVRATAKRWGSSRQAEDAQPKM
ncbi:hypothetical protein BC629DRAFT_1441412 [Irpex lacteus]|nr:hypothetical protein BC629DRAFT_1441412 [Irpex lacteus]